MKNLHSTFTLHAYYTPGPIICEPASIVVTYMRHLLGPVGELHHEEENSQHHHEMEEGVAVCDSLCFVIVVMHSQLPLVVIIVVTCFTIICMEGGREGMAYGV